MPDYVELGRDPFSAHQLLLGLAAGASSVLDVGCSAGTLSRVLAERGAVVDGIELDPVAAREAERFCRQVLVGDLETVELPPEHYDLILCGDIIEHLRDPVAALAKLRPHLKPGGRLVASVPNVANWSQRLLLLAGRWDYHDRGLLDRTHLRFFTLRTFRKTLAEAGYRIERMEVTVPLPVLRRRPFNAWAHALGLLWKNLLAYQFIAVARPPS